MHTHSITDWQHSHVFLGGGHAANERRTWAVVALTVAAMVIEIAGGYVLGSMALVADGWHMATHAAALGLAALAYRLADHYRDDPRFSFGTGKLGELAGYTSAVVLGLVALMIGWEAIERLAHPVAIQFGEAIPIAVLGLAVNVASVWLLGGHGHDHAHHDDRDTDVHDHERDEAHTHDHDTNMRAAYAHVLADAVTSLLAILALTAGLLLGWTWLDAAVALAGAGVIMAWAITLVHSAGGVLLDTVPDAALSALIRSRVEIGGDRIADLHLWRIGPGHVAAVISVVSDAPQPPASYKQRLDDVGGLSHVTVEVIACPHHGAGSGSGMPAC